MFWSLFFTRTFSEDKLRCKWGLYSCVRTRRILLRSKGVVQLPTGEFQADYITKSACLPCLRYALLKFCKQKYRSEMLCSLQPIKSGICIHPSKHNHYKNEAQTAPFPDHKLASKHRQTFEYCNSVWAVTAICHQYHPQLEWWLWHQWCDCTALASMSWYLKLLVMAPKAKT